MGIFLMEVATADKGFCGMFLKAGHPCVEGVYMDAQLPCDLCCRIYYFFYYHPEGKPKGL